MVEDVVTGTATGVLVVGVKTAWLVLVVGATFVTAVSTICDGVVWVWSVVTTDVAIEVVAVVLTVCC